MMFRHHKTKPYLWIMTLLLLGLWGGDWAKALTTRIKDIVNFQGVRENQLVGYGLVIGLNGTGDSLRRSIFTKESIVSMLERLGVNIREVGDLDTKNIAAVMVTATLPAFARIGSHIDVTVSAMGDAKNLLGGTLLVTPLVGADGEVYAVTQGSVATSGFAAQGKASSVTKGVPTSGRIANGAIVEKEIGYELANLDVLNLSLRNPDFTTAQRIERAINKELGAKIASAMDGSTIKLDIPTTFANNRVDLFTRIEQLQIEPDQPARIVVDDHDGVIVMDENVRIRTVAISHGSLTVKITEEEEVSQPNSFTGGTGGLIQTRSDIGDTTRSITDKNTQPTPQGPQGIEKQDVLKNTLVSNTQTMQAPGGASTQKVDRTKIDAGEADSKVSIINGGASLQELVDSLNALGANPRDLIVILQSIKAAGALQASIEVI